MLKNRKLKNKIPFIILTLIFVSIFSVLYIIKPKETKSANFTSATATLGSSRFSYLAGITTGTSGSSNVQIDSSGNPDNNVNHLFPGDTVCFTNTEYLGCSDDVAYTVAATEGVGGDQFTTNSPLASSLGVNDIAIATSSGSLAIAVTLVNDVPNGGDLLITIPMANSVDGNDSFPDFNTTVATSGFDLNGITVDDISVSTSTSGTCVNGDWTATETITEGSGSSDHTIRVDRSGSSCEANSTTVTITIDSDPGIINPAPINAARTQGAADEYTINIKSRDNTDATIDESDVMVAPVEAVLVSATVEETLTFQVCGVDTDLSTQEAGCFSTPASICGEAAALDVATYAYSVPFGAISTAETFLDAAQYMEISTNADGGYAVTIQQNDQMGKDGATCTGNPTDPVTSNCIPDNPGDAALNFDTSDDCDTASVNGLCFSQDDGPETGSPTFAVKYDVTGDSCDPSPTFCARSAADQENGPETPQTIISATNPSASHDGFVCWRLSVDGTQPAGYYFNKVMYVATPVF
ncbi:hypothetical protein ACFL0F_01800 [Patescibacteria group bacterium]